MYADPETRQKYFKEDAQSDALYEYYPPEYAIKKPFLPNDNYVQAVRDKYHNPRVGGTIIPVCDPQCEKWDAARHIKYLKRSVIMAPRDGEELQIFLMERDKKYHKRLAIIGKPADLQNWHEFKRRKEAKSRKSKNRSPTLDKFFKKTRTA